PPPRARTWARSRSRSRPPPRPSLVREHWPCVDCTIVSDPAKFLAMAHFNTVITTYLVRADAVDDFRALLERHWPVLRELELVSEAAPQYFVGHPNEDGGVPVVEIFEWAGE